MEDWKPTASDIRWTQNLIEHIKEGGIWGTSFAGYSLHHSKKILKLLDIFDQAGWDFEENHHRVKIVFEELGWKVEDEECKRLHL